MELLGSSWPFSFSFILGGGGGGGRMQFPGGEDVEDTIPPEGTRNSLTSPLKTIADCMLSRGLNCQIQSATC